MNVLLTIIGHVKSLLTPTYEIMSTKHYDSIKFVTRTSTGGTALMSLHYYKRMNTIEVHVQAEFTKQYNLKIVEIPIEDIRNLTEHISYNLLPYLINANTQLEGVEQKRVYDIINVMVSKLYEHNKEFKFTGKTSTLVEVEIKDIQKKLDLVVTDGFYVQTENKAYKPLSENHLLGAV